MSLLRSLITRNTHIKSKELILMEMRIEETRFFSNRYISRSLFIEGQVQSFVKAFPKLSQTSISFQRPDFLSHFSTTFDCRQKRWIVSQNFTNDIRWSWLTNWIRNSSRHLTIYAITIQLFFSTFWLVKII